MKIVELGATEKYCRMANFSLIFHFWVFSFLIFPKRGLMFFSVSNFPVLCQSFISSVPKSKVRFSLCLLSQDMYRIVFSCVVYSHMKAFGKNGGKKLTEKLAIVQYMVSQIWQRGGSACQNREAGTQPMPQGVVMVMANSAVISAGSWLCQDEEQNNIEYLFIDQFPPSI